MASLVRGSVMESQSRLVRRSYTEGRCSVPRLRKLVEFCLCGCAGRNTHRDVGLSSRVLVLTLFSWFSHRVYVKLCVVMILKCFLFYFYIIIIVVRGSGGFK